MKIINVVRVGLWQRILDTVNDNNYLWGWKSVNDYNNLQCCLFDKDWLTNIISSYDLEKLSANEPIFIAAQTGRGKTTLVFKNMLPVALKRRKKILYLSNRILLSKQIKEYCIDDELNGEQRVGEIFVKDFKTYFTKEYLKMATRFGGIDVYTYQSFLHKHSEIDPSEYAFVVMDESHAFISDATYNVFTEEILDLLVKKFSKVCRVYLTATPQECIDTIYDKELSVEKHMNLICPSLNMKVYVLSEDYSYLIPYFFKSTKYIIDKIKGSSDTDNWLIFVRNKKAGEFLLSELKDLPGGAMYITSESDKEDESYQELIVNEKLPKRILISTKVLDVGVNIRTSNLHMVIFENDVVEVKQMIGRKRVKEHESLEVFFCIPSYSFLKKRKTQIEREILKQKNHVIYKDKLKESYITGFSELYPLYLNNKEIKANNLSIKKHQYDNCYYEEMLDNLKIYENDESKYQVNYASLCLRNFAGQVFDFSMMIEEIENQDVSDEKTKKVYELLKEWSKEEISKDELDKFSKELTDIIGDCRSTKRSDRGYMKFNTLSQVLPKYGYTIINNDKTPVTYNIKISGNRKE